MTISSRLARPLISSIFISGGLDALRHPESKVKAAAAVVEPLTDQISGLPKDATIYVKINGAVQVAAGGLLAMGKWNRLAAVSLVASLVPTTYAGHRFWEEDDPALRATQQIHFLKNLGLIGGLILAATDRGGAPSMTWRAKSRAGALGNALDAKRTTTIAHAHELVDQGQNRVHSAREQASYVAGKAAAALPFG